MPLHVCLCVVLFELTLCFCEMLGCATLLLQAVPKHLLRGRTSLLGWPAGELQLAAGDRDWLCLTWVLADDRSDGRPDGRAVGQSDGRSDRRTDGRGRTVGQTDREASPSVCPTVRPRPSVRLSDRPSVCPTARPSDRPSDRPSANTQVGQSHCLARYHCCHATDAISGRCINGRSPTV